MAFNSWEFLVFFPLAAAGCFFITMRLRSNTLSRFFLLACSFFFYGCWNPAYLGLILTSVTVTWASGLLMEGRGVLGKRFVLAACLAINLGILFFFKYYGFFTKNFLAVTHYGIRLPSFDVLLPVGISFYTFQALGYAIDVYRGRERAERNLVTYALFVTFFPQLVAGPIERTGNLLPQFKVNHDFDYDRVTSGLRLAAWGMFKKVVIADRLAVYVNGVYGNPQVYPAATLALATFFFAFQIYCDFSAYSDIAVGCARILGFNLMTNFRQPYFSRSVTDFWRRWHISLSTWFRDYVYIPLGGSRKGAARQNINVMITFLISGLWHGAGWHFAVWGALHGLFQVIGRSTLSLRSAAGNRIGLPDKCMLRKLLQICFTFILVCVAWIFFRAKSLSSALLICKKMTALPGEIITCFTRLPQTGIVFAIRTMFSLGHGSSGFQYFINGFYLKAGLFSLILICLVVVVDLLSGKQPCQVLVKRCPLAIRWAGYYLLILAIMQSWPKENQAAIEFIYFAF